jgi:FSR family fosmidomycin resistance protein-like MFS transporter
MNSRDTTIVVEPQADTAAPARAGVLSLILLSLGHFSVDVYAGALGALQPLLVEKLHTSLTQVGILGGVLVFSSSVMQPVYGYLSDRFHTRLFTVLGPAVAGIFISSLGLAPAYVWLLLLVLLGGTGVASYHPQASARAVLGPQQQRGRAMAVFVSSGTLGAALGPTYFSAVAATWGLSRTYWAAVPGVLAAVLLAFAMPALPAPAPHERRRFDWAPILAVWKPLVVLYLLVFLRSVVQITFGQFLPLYLHSERGFAVSNANYVLSAFVAAGAVGGFVGGHLADRFGGRTVIQFSMIACVPFLAVFFFARGWFSIAGLILGGFILLFTIPVNVVMAQKLAPSQTGTVSALMMGFAWGMSGMVFIPMVGFAADLFSLHSALASLMVFPVIGFFLTLKLPK